MRRPEQEIQRAVVRHLRARPAPNIWFCHIPNGGWRSRTEAAIFKALGVEAGAPDLIAVKGGRFYALELKAPDGKLTDLQNEALIALKRAGACVGVAYGLDQAIAWLEQHGLLRGSAVLCKSHDVFVRASA